MRRNIELKKEQKKALSVFFDNIHHFHRFLNKRSSLGRHASLLPSGFIATSFQPFLISNLPRGTHWQWNQSNRKVTICVESEIFVTFRKLCVKRKYSTSPESDAVPSFKIWIFEVEYGEFASSQYLLWCEKGLGIETDIGTIFPENVSTGDLSFLKPFMDQFQAEELGW